MRTPPRPSGEFVRHPGRGAGSERLGYAVGFTVSAVLHLVLLFLYGSQGPPSAGGSVAWVPETDTRVLDGTRILRIVEIPAGEPGASPDEPVEVDVTSPDPGEIRTDVPGEEVDSRLDAPPPPVAERLRTQAAEGDERLWNGVDPALVEPTPEQRARLQLLGRIEAMNDSAAAAEAAATAITDWTYTDDEGKRWGVSPGKLHLGNLTLPMPFAFGPPPDPTGARTRRTWQWQDIEGQAGSAAARESWKERAEEIRRRRDAERADTIGSSR